MIKELFITALLSFGVSSSSAESSRFVRGYYCFKDNPSESLYFDMHLSNRDGISYYSSVYNQYLSDLFDFYIGIDPQDDICDFRFTWSVDTQEYHDNEYDFANFTEFFQNLILYFSEPFYMSAENYTAFNNYFGNSNSTNTFYNGYYALYDSVNFNNVNNFSLEGTVTINNLLGDGISKGYLENFYNNGSLTLTNRNVFIGSILIPNKVRTEMVKIGTFTYVPNTENNSFQDLFYSIADTPVIFLYNMFSFDVLGQNLFVAFASLITVLLFVIIVRKLI